MSAVNASPTRSNLLLLSQAAQAIFKSRNTFWRHHKRQIVPPPVLTIPVCRWDRNQLQLFRRGKLQQNENGIWFQFDDEKECWRKLPNQYVDTLPPDAK